MRLISVQMNRAYVGCLGMLRRSVLGCLPLLSAGCLSHTVPIDALSRDDALEVRLDANSRMHQPGKRQIKFFVDITNRSGSRLDLARLKVELQAMPEASPGTVSLRQDWSYRWGREVHLAPGKKLTVPIVPEQGVEFPLEALAEGNYGIVAVVNKRHVSPPYKLAIARPDLGTRRR